MFQEFLAFLNGTGEQVAAFLSSGAYWVWPILVRHAFTKALALTLLATSQIVVWDTLAIVSIVRNKNLDNLTNSRTDDISGAGAWYIITWIAAAIATIVFLVTATEQLPRLLNPEYYALKEAETLINSLVR